MVFCYLRLIGKDCSSLSPLLYWLRFFGYLFDVKLVLRRLILFFLR